MVKVRSNMFVQRAFKRAKPLLMGKMAVVILVFLLWHYLLCVSLHYYKIGELCVIIWEPSLPVAVVGVDRHHHSDHKLTSSASVFPWAWSHLPYLFHVSEQKSLLLLATAAVLPFYKTFICLFSYKYIHTVTSERRVEGSAYAWIGRGKCFCCVSVV